MRIPRVPERRLSARGVELVRTGKLFEAFLTPIVDRAYRARRIAAIGLGLRSDFTVDRARRSAAAIAINARQKRIARIAFRADGELDSPQMIQAVAEGMTLAEFDAGSYKTAGYDPFELTGLGIIVTERADEQGERAARDAVRRGRVVGEH